MNPSSFVSSWMTIVSNASILKMPFLAALIHSGGIGASWKPELPAVHSGSRAVLTCSEDASPAGAGLVTGTQRNGVRRPPTCLPAPDTV